MNDDFNISSQKLPNIGLGKNDSGQSFVPSSHVEKKSDALWTEEEGQLSVDILETEKEIIVVSTMAGASEETLEILIQNDLLTIRGERASPMEELSHYDRILQHYHKECFWGKFSRTIVLPHDVKSEMTTATLKNGVLIIRLPKRQQTARISVTIVED